jgi:glucosylglycerate synthase
VNVERMLTAFRRAAHELREVWELALDRPVLDEIMRLGAPPPPGASAGSSQPFHISDELWARVVIGFACAHKRRPLLRGQLLPSLTPLYLARVASFVIETRTMVSADVEDRIEHLCLAFEELKPYLLRKWTDKETAAPARGTVTAEETAQAKLRNKALEV